MPANDIQAVNAVFTGLLDALDAACNAAGIPYVLWGRTALGAFRGNGAPLGYDGVAHAAIRLEDARELESVLNGLRPGKYRCVSWMSAPGYPELSLRLVDLETSRIKFEEIGIFSSEGIHVLVHCLRPSTWKVRGGKEAAEIKALKAAEIACFTGRVKGHKLWEAAFAPAGGHFADCVPGSGTDYPARRANVPMEAVARGWLASGGSADCLMSWAPSHRKPLRFDSDLLEDVLISPSGSWPLPRDLDAFMSKTFCADWRNAESKAFSGSPAVWVSASVPYARVLGSSAVDAGDLRDVHRCRADYLRLRARFKDLADDLTKYRRRIKVVGIAREVEKRYCGELRPRVIDAYNRGDEPELGDLFSEYRKAFETAKNEHHGCVLLDPVLNEIYLEFLASNGEEGLCGYLRGRQKHATAGNLLVMQVPLGR